MVSNVANDAWDDEARVTVSEGVPKPSVDAIMKVIDELGRELDDPEIEPDPEKFADPAEAAGDVAGYRDSARMRRQRVAALASRATDLLTSLPAALAELDDEAQRAGLLGMVVGLAGEVAGPSVVAGDHKAARNLLVSALDVLPEGHPSRPELSAASDDLDGFAKLVWGRWKVRKGEESAGDALLKKAKASSAKGVAESAQATLDRPRPIGQAPGLFTLNGFGTHLYGARDKRPDGTYVTTLCLCAIFVPVLPIFAYRVFDQGGGRYTFYSREPLSRFAKGYRVLAVLAALSGIGGVATLNYLQSDGRLSAIAMEEARTLERAGQREQALGAYQDVLTTYIGSVPEDRIDRAASGVVRLAAASIHEPFEPSSVEAARAIAQRIQPLRHTRGNGPAQEALVAKLERWSGQLGDATLERIEASIELLDLGVAATLGPPHDRAATLAGDRRLVLAARLAPDRPLDALHHYASVGPRPEAVEGIASVVRSLEGPAAWLEAKPVVASWLPLAPEDAGARARERIAEAEALGADAERRAAIDSGDEAGLAERLAKNPRDEEVARRVADMRRAAGDPGAAIAALEGVGPAGRLTGEGQVLLSSCLVDDGRLAGADAILGRWLSWRLPAFRAARDAYDAAVQAQLDGYLRQVRSAYPPRDFALLLQGAPAHRHQAIYDEWVSAKIRADPALTALRDVATRFAAVVPACLLHGTVKLRLAGESSGGAKQSLLSDAERLFLAIRSETEGDPTFHVGLGQVYHRLGRTQEGERELGVVLRSGDPAQKLGVARAYRELGLHERARTIARDLHGQSPSPTRQDAAVLLYLLADTLEEEERWLRAADPSDVFVQSSLRQLQGEKLARDGRLGEAAQVFEQVAAEHERSAGHDASSANNAAHARIARYGCSGDPSDLERAVRLQETAARLMPGDAVVILNLSTLLAYDATVRVLGRHLRTRTLRLAPFDAEGLLSSMLAGPRADEVRAALRGEPSLRRSLDVARQEAVLAARTPRAHDRERGWLWRIRDAQGLRALSERLSGLPAFEAEPASTDTVDVGRAELDEIEAQIRRAQAIAAEAARTRDPATIAAAASSRGSWLWSRVYDQAQVAPAEAVAAAYREADSAWPDLGAKTDLAAALVVVAILESATTVPALGEAWRTQGRDAGLDVLLHRFSSGPQGAAAMEAMRGRPALREAVAIRKALTSSDPQVGDWVLARWVGDAAWEAAATEALRLPAVRLSAEISARLHPGSTRDAGRLEILRAATP